MTCTDQKTIWPHRSIDWIDTPGNIEKPIQVPCGKCIPCLMSKRSDWCFRLEQEYKYSKTAYFVTLTYDQKHCPDQLEVIHLQLYLKKVRKALPNEKIRYYAVGEYGSKSGRPHYHLIIFNATEEVLRSKWTDKQKRVIGLVHIGRVTPASVAYCTKYILQPELSNGKKKAFATMSRAYGIGAMYLQDNMVKWHRDNDANYVMRYNEKGRLPRFYREKIWYKPKDRERISSKAMKLTLENQEKERNYWKQEHGDNWETAMLEARSRLLERVKVKIKYTQTI